MSKIPQLEALLSENPKDCFLLHALGLEHVKLGDYDAARRFFIQVLEQDADYVGTYYHLGKTYEELDDVELAMDTYRKGAEVAERIEDTHAKSELDMAIWELED